MKEKIGKMVLLAYKVCEFSTKTKWFVWLDFSIAMKKVEAALYEGEEVFYRVSFKLTDTNAEQKIDEIIGYLEMMKEDANVGKQNNETSF